MASPKDEVRELLSALPEEASFEDIQYHIYVRQKIQRGLDAADQGDVVEDGEIESRMSKWLGE